MKVNLHSVVCIAAIPVVSGNSKDDTVKEGDPVDFSCSYDILLNSHYYC